MNPLKLRWQRHVSDADASRIRRAEPCSKHPPGPAPDLGVRQGWLVERITRPVGVPARVPLDDGRWIVGGRISAGERLAIYQRGYFARLVECLADDYPAVAHAVGPADFEALCLDFIEAHPPASPSLNFYGAPFADFCATWPAPGIDFASELARLEWAVVECIHADAGQALDPVELAALSAGQWERARLVPSPALRVLATSYPVQRHYRAFLEGENPETPAFEPTTIAVCRRGDRVCRVGVEASFVALLRRLLRGEPLATALMGVPADASHGASRAAELERVLCEWVTCGFFAAVRTD